MAYIRRIVTSMANILDKSYRKLYQKTITTDIKIACYKNLEYVIHIIKNKNKTQLIKKIFSLIFVEMKEVQNYHYQEFVILAQLLQCFKDILKEKKNEIDCIIKKKEVLFDDGVDVIDPKDVKLHAIMEEDEDELFDDMVSSEYNQYINKYGAILSIYQKLQDSKIRKCLSPLEDKLRN